jgi:membrane protein
MAGLYLSWFILLLGAQVAYAFQNRALYLQEKLSENVNQRGREFVAFRLMTSVCYRFARGMIPTTVDQMSNELGVPSRLVQQVLQTLLAARLVTEVAGKDPAYTPARPLDSITTHHILMAMRATSGQELMTRDEPVRAEVFGEFARIQEAEKEVASSVTMLDLVNRAQRCLELAAPPEEDETLKLTSALIPKQTPAAPPRKKQS